MSELWRRLRVLFRRERFDRDLEEEMQSHIEMQAEENRQDGMEPEEARYAARRQFGNLTVLKETSREAWSWRWLEALVQDLRYALRTFRRSPGFAVAAILSLALGIGGNTSIFSLVNQVMLLRLPVANPDELVRFDAPGPNFGMQRDYPHTLSYPMFKALHDQNQVFSGVIAHFAANVNLIENGEAERVRCHLVSGNYFRVLGIPAAAGRLLSDDDDQKPGGHPVAVLTYEFWQRRFGGDPSIVGRGITLNQTAMTVVGVSGFRGLTMDSPADLIVPIMMKPQMVVWWPGIFNPREAWLHVYGRLKPGVSHKQAQAAMNVLYRNMLAEESRQITGISENLRREFLSRRLELAPGQRGYSALRETFRQPLGILMVAVGLVLLIACANVAGLLSARSAARRSEFTMRLALGAGRRRLIRQLMTESLALSIAGGTVGLGIAWWLAGALIGMLPFDNADRIFYASPDLRAIAFTFGIATLATLIFGLAPAIQSTQPTLMGDLRGETGASAGLAKARFRRLLVGSQFALSLLLTIAAGLFARTLYNLRTTDLGFPKENLIVADIDPRLNGYPEERVGSLLDLIEVRLSAIPGVRGVGLAGLGPFNNGSDSGPVKIEGYTPQQSEDVVANVVAVGPGFFRAVGVSLVAGREFTERDDAHSRRVAIITSSIARRYFGGDAIGKHIGWRDVPGLPHMEVVGVVSDISPLDLRGRRDFVFGPARQWGPFQMSLHVRTALPPESLFQPIRKAMREVDPAVPVVGINTMEARLQSALFAQRMIALLSACFGTLAVILAAIGLSGVIAWSVARRTREFGIRMALGAHKNTVLALVMKEVGVMMVAGTSVGVVCALLTARLVRSQLFGVQPADPLTFAVAALLLLTVGVAAGLIPARRAMDLDPAVALRHE